MNNTLTLETFTVNENTEGQIKSINYRRMQEMACWNKPYWPGADPAKVMRVMRLFSSLPHGRERNKWLTWTLKHQFKGEIYSGNLPKRLQALAWKEHEINIPDNLMEKIGTVLSEDRITRPGFFEVDKFTDWKHGDFEKTNNPGACWWNNFSEGRLGLPDDPAGFTLLVYASEDDWKENRRVSGIGRCFMYQMDNAGFVMFNAYGAYPLSTMAAIMGNRYSTVPLRATLTANWPTYINQGNSNNQGRQGGTSGICYYIGTNRRTLYILPDFRIKNNVCSECHNSYTKSGVQDVRVIQGDGGTSIETLCLQCTGNIGRCERCEMPARLSVPVLDEQGSTKKSCVRCAVKIPSCSYCKLKSTFLTPIHHSQLKACPNCLDEKKHAAECCVCGRVVDKFMAVGESAICYNHKVRAK